MNRNYDCEIDENILKQNYKKSFDYITSDFVISKFAKHMNRSVCLEVGCYDGYVSRKLSNYYEKVIAIDASQVSITNCESTIVDMPSNVEFVHAEFVDFVKNKRIDAHLENPEGCDVVMMNILEHFDDPRLALNMVKKLMKRNNLLFIQVPNVSSLSRRIATKMGIYETIEDISEFEMRCGHRHNFSFATLTNLLTESGFEIIDMFGAGLKTLSSAQFESALDQGIISQDYVNAIFELGLEYPDISGSVCLMAEIHK